MDETRRSLLENIGIAFVKIAQQLADRSRDRPRFLQACTSWQRSVSEMSRETDFLGRKTGSPPRILDSGFFLPKRAYHHFDSYVTGGATKIETIFMFPKRTNIFYSK